MTGVGTTANNEPLRVSMGCQERLDGDPRTKVDFPTSGRRSTRASLEWHPSRMIPGPRCTGVAGRLVRFALNQRQIDLGSRTSFGQVAANFSHSSCPQHGADRRRQFISGRSQHQDPRSQHRESHLEFKRGGGEEEATRSEWNVLVTPLIPRRLYH